MVYENIQEWKDGEFEAFVSGYKNNSGEWEEKFFRKVFTNWREFDTSSMNQEIIKAIKEVENILKDRLVDKTDDDLDFSKIRSKPEPPGFKTVPSLPQEPDKKYSLLSALWGGRDFTMSKKKQMKIIQKRVYDYKIKYSVWRKEKEQIDQENARNKEGYQMELNKWFEEKNIFEIKSRGIEKLSDICRKTLIKSRYPKIFPKEFKIFFNVDNRILVVDYQLPSFGQIPTLKEIRYIKSKDKRKVIFLPESAQNVLYDDLLYQITLRTLHELYLIDKNKILKSIVFNGWIRSINKGTGKEVNLCILSVQANREEFLSINLENVDPKACFKSLKGVGSSKLHGMAPVAPIMNIDKNDKRFVNPYEVANKINEGTNIAAMDWKDFENLIRELFEEEFKTVGGEVKITRASRDAGVDAIAFDPDPIRGGKIVIQAKRYTNTVGVSAVRDLYGTVMNEGATKGILVTTTDYGPDAYKFANNKPLTLLNGSNLLHLLEKHGHKANINIKEAKKILAEQENVSGNKEYKVN